MPEDAPKVTIAGKEYPLHRPQSFALRNDIILAAALNPVRGTAAALGVCLAKDKLFGFSYASHRHDALSYGGAVLDFFVEKKLLTGQQVVELGAIAFQLCREAIPTEGEVAAEEGFSGPAPGPATG